MKYDVLAEGFRTTAVEYRLLVTKVTAVMRKDRVYVQEWTDLW